MLAIYKRELRSYFQSMVGPVFVAFLIAFTGIYFMAYNLVSGYPYFSYTLSGSLIVFIVGIPLITMRSFSEERKNKTDQLLLTAPVSLGKVVMGKYLAMVTVIHREQRILQWTISQLRSSFCSAVSMRRSVCSCHL